MNQKVLDAIKKVVELIENEKLEKISMAVFRGVGKPSDSWSFFNRMLMLSQGTDDARGYRQWQEVGRYVKKGAKAIYIIVPIYKKVKMKREGIEEEMEKLKEKCNGCANKCENSETACKGCETAKEIEALKELLYVEVEKLVSFKAVPVFAKEDTEGAPLKDDREVYQIPCEFEGIIRELNLDVKITSFNERRGFYGFYSPIQREIVLASPEIRVFLHELAHAVDDALHDIRYADRHDAEFVAELSAAVIGYMLGYRIPLGQVKTYLKQLKPTSVYRVLQRVERVVSYIIEKTRKDAISTAKEENVIPVNA